MLFLGLLSRICHDAISFMKKSKFASLGLLLFPVLFSCSSTRPAPLREVVDDSKKTTVLLDYSLVRSDDSEKNGQCVISLVRLESHLSYRVDLKSEKKMIEFEAPPGAYQVERLSCEHGATWELK